MASWTILLMSMTLLVGSLVDGGVIKSASIAEKPTAEPENKTREVRSLSPQKRPFCNAFTGCGKKRSSEPANLNYEQVPNQGGNEGNSVEADSINAVFDFNSEPAVADLMQQILSEAKLWEAVQAATVEFKKQKHMQHKYPTFSAQ